MKPLEFMQKYYERYAHNKVKVVAFPLPPCRVNNIIFMPDCYSSNSLDMIFNREEDEFTPISIKHTALGPALLLHTRLSKLISFDEKTGLIRTSGATLCASVSYLTFGKDKGLKYVEEATLDSFMMIGKSCHPGSHFVIPRAPFLTSLVQISQSRTVEDNEKASMIYTHPHDPIISEIFPKTDFSCNLDIDNFIGHCAVDIDTRGGGKTNLGDWGLVYLKSLRWNQIRMKESKDAWDLRSEVQLSGLQSQEDVSQEHPRCEGTQGALQGEECAHHPVLSGAVSSGSEAAQVRSKEKLGSS